MKKLRKTLRLLVAAVLAAIAALAVAAVAFGDTVGADMDNLVANDQGNGATIVLKPGDSRTGTFWLQDPNGSPSTDRNGCNVGGASSGQAGTLSLTQDSQNLLVIGTPSGVFEDCDDPATVGTREGAQTAAYTVDANACGGGSTDKFASLNWTVIGGKTGALYVGGSITVQVDCSQQPAVCEEPAAPAIVSDHLRNDHSLQAKQPTFKTAITWAAKQMGSGGAFNNPCAANYRADVLAALETAVSH